MNSAISTYWLENDLAKETSLQGRKVMESNFFNGEVYLYEKDIAFYCIGWLTPVYRLSEHARPK
jgi:hypothetical protein